MAKREPIPHQGYTQQDDPSGPDPILWGKRAAGIVAALIVWVLLGGSEGLSADGRAVAAIAVLMGVYWMTEALPLPATALLPIILLPAFAGIPVSDATAPFANSLVFLFLGGFLIAIAVEKWDLHERIALMVLDFVGVSPRRIVLGMMTATAFLSMWVSNVATTLMMLPIGISVLTLVVQRSVDADRDIEDELEDAAISEIVEDPDIRSFGVCLTLAIAWSASIGGLGTLVGSTPNAIVAGYASDQLDRDLGFLEWMIFGVPLVVIFILVSWFLMTRVLYRFSLDEIPGGSDMIKDRLAELGPMSPEERRVGMVFGGAAFLWVVPALLSNIPGLGFMDGLDDTAIAIAMGGIMFAIPASKGERGEMLLGWDDAENGLPWGILLLFGGGLSLAAAVAATGLDQWFGQQVEALGMLPTILLIGIVALMVQFITEIASNTATAAAFIPVLGGVAAGIGVEPLLLLVPAAFAATCAFMLPVSTPPNAIVFATGNVTIAEMVRGGFVLNIVGVTLITGIFYFIGAIALGL